MHHTLKYFLPGKHSLWLLICTASIGLSLFLQWNGQIITIGGDHDSLKYLEMAEALINDKWFGEYNHMTLIRQPGYSFFLVLNSKMGWPLQRSQTVLYLISILVLMAALRSVDVARWRIAVICILCSFHPAAILASMYLATEATYTVVATIVLAGCIGVMGSVKKNGVQIYFWLIIFSASLAYFWQLRSESLWILPLGITSLSYILWEFRYCWRKNWVILSLTMMIPCLCVYLMTGFLQNENKKHYGIGVTHELNEPNLVSAFNWLTRMDAGHHHPYVPVTRVALGQAYEVSPHFSLLKPALSQQVEGRGWAKFGCEWMGICDELAGGWILWAVRDAAASVGVYQSATSASRFFAEVAGEIKTACKEGRVRCADNPTGNMLAPPLMWQDLPRIFESFVKMAVLSFTFGKLSEVIQDTRQLEPSAELVARYDRITHDQSPSRKNVPNPFIGAAIRLFQLFQIAGGIWIVITVGKKSWQWMISAQAASSKSLQTHSWVAGCLIVFIISRLAVVAYIDAMSFYAQLRYLLVVYPALITLICLLLPFYRSCQR